MSRSLTASAGWCMPADAPIYDLFPPPMSVLYDWAYDEDLADPDPEDDLDYSQPTWPEEW